MKKATEYVLDKASINSNKYSTLEKVKEPKDLKSFSIEQLKALSEELRNKTIETVSKTGGHLGAGLGVVELTVAIHYVFDTPKDLLIWDVGHQSYPHKILTGRADKIETLRKEGGLSGFPKRSESIYDAFGTGHSSTSISAGLGMAVARDYHKKNREVIAVIGDGAISAGQAYEAMNNAGYLKNRMIVILNDNDMSIARPVGAMSSYLSNLVSSKTYMNLRDLAKKFVSHLPKPIENLAKKTEQYARNIANDGGNFFEEMGFYYIGPIDGHNIEDLVTILNNIKNDNTSHGPFLLHVITEKGKGFKSSKECEEKYHAVTKFDPQTNLEVKAENPKPSYTKIFAESLIEEAKEDNEIVAITAAMPSGTGLNLFAKVFPDRMFDVGIAEQHAVTFAAGLATDNIKPFVCIYSTFLQRAYDQLIHDVAIQSLPVRFIIDRAGIVGADGATHSGNFDLAYLTCIPKIIIMAPSDELELKKMVKTVRFIDDRPSCIRFPRGEALGIDLRSEKIEKLEIGKARIIKKEGEIAIISVGTTLSDSIAASEILEKEHNIKTTIIDARFIKPIDEELFERIAKTYKAIITIEEGSIGGFSSIFNNFLLQNSFLDSGKLKIRNIFLSDEFPDHGTQDSIRKKAGISAENIVNKVLELNN